MGDQRICRRQIRPEQNGRGYREARRRRARTRRVRHELRAVGRPSWATATSRTRRPVSPPGPPETPIGAGPIGVSPVTPPDSPDDPSRSSTRPFPYEVGAPVGSPARTGGRSDSTPEPGALSSPPIVKPIGSGRSRRRRSSRASPSRSERRIPSARQIAARTSDDASLRPRSTSDRYGMETPAAAATSRSVRPCRTRSRRNTPPITRRSNDMLRLAFAVVVRGACPIMPTGPGWCGPGAPPCETPRTRYVVGVQATAEFGRDER